MCGVVFGFWFLLVVFLSCCRNFVNFGNGSLFCCCVSFVNLVFNYECMEEVIFLELSGFELSFYCESLVSIVDLV